MTIEIDWTLVWMVCSGLFTVLLGWMLWSARKQFASSEDVTALAMRTQKLEDQAKETPGRAAIHELSMAMQELRGELRVANERTTGMRDTVDRLERVVQRQEEYLLNNNKGGK